jgi:L,D-transpeptidase YcbB
MNGPRKPHQNAPRVAPAPRGTFSRRRFLSQGSAFAAAAVSASAGASAQDTANWWDRLTGSTAKAVEPQKRQPEILNDLRPDNTPWRSDVMVDALGDAIARFEKIAGAGGWPSIPGSRMIRPEDSDDRVPALRRRLETTGDLRGQAASTWGSMAYDSDVETAVKRFQESHGLRISGRVDKSTLAALNVPVQERIQQMRLNQKRLQDLIAQRPEDRYVLVNSAAYQLEAVERGEVQQRHRVIVGRPGRETPIVRATIRALNFFPHWRVPDSIATLDLIPRMQKDGPDYLTKEKIRVLQTTYSGPEVDPMAVDWQKALASVYKFRQDPGPQNALGLVRIDMPNSEGVYMHDTPLKDLFKQRLRPFSAGCVRVEGVFKLAEWIARYEQGWEQPGKVEPVLEAGQALDLTLTRQVPVYFTYITAWAEPTGRVQFRPDVYNRDGIGGAATGRDREDGEGPAPSGGLAP